MKNMFIEYHIDEHLSRIFSEATIVLDTNSILNLYRYSNETRTKYLEILSKSKDRLYTTYQISSEFYRNRYTLVENRSSFKSDLKIIIEDYYGKLLNIINNSSSSDSKTNSCLGILKHEDELRNQIIAEVKDSKDKLEKSIDSFADEIDLNYIKIDDPILKEVVTIYEGKISSEISKEEMESLLKEGQQRFKDKIPPGYKDVDKPEPDRYGDFIIWKELQKLSKQSNVDILFVSDDRKEDWVIEYKGQDLGTRRDLIKEFYKETGKLFYAISTKEFIKFATDKYSVRDTELLEKETEIIREKIRDEETTKDAILLEGFRNDLITAKRLSKSEDFLKKYGPYTTLDDSSLGLLKKIEDLNSPVVNSDSFLNKYNSVYGIDSLNDLLNKYGLASSSAMNNLDWIKKSTTLTGIDSASEFLKKYGLFNSPVNNIDWLKKLSTETGTDATIEFLKKNTTKETDRIASKIPIDEQADDIKLNIQPESPSDVGENDENIKPKQKNVRPKPRRKK